jgi:hypothetical protein
MQDRVNATAAPKRVLWNKGKLTGTKPPLRPKHVWSIRTKRQIEGRVRDLAMSNLAIDSKLRGCDVVAIQVGDVAACGYTADRATVRRFYRCNQLLHKHPRAASDASPRAYKVAV